MNQVATIGHNAPPSPFDEISIEINDLYGEAKLWLDGEPILTQEQADALNTLRSKINDAAKKAEALRKDEVAPLDTAKAEIQDRFNPLIGKTKTVTGKTVTGKTVLAIECVKDALKPYLLELDRKQREEAEKARAEAAEKERIAREAFQNKKTLEDAEKAEEAIQQSIQADKDAKRAASEKAHAKGNGRATGLRSVWKAKMVDEREASAWLWKNNRSDLMAFVQECADKAVRSGERNISGFEILEERVL